MCGEEDKDGDKIFFLFSAPFKKDGTQVTDCVDLLTVNHILIFQSFTSLSLSTTPHPHTHTQTDKSRPIPGYTKVKS